MICRLFISSGITLPLLLVVTEGSLAAITGDWGVSDLILDKAGPAEFDARIRRLLASEEISDSQAVVDALHGQGILALQQVDLVTGTQALERALAGTLQAGDILPLTRGDLSL